MARGEIIILLNVDTKVLDDWCKNLVTPMLQNEKIGITGSKLIYDDQKHIQHAGGYFDRLGCTKHFGYEEEDRGQWDRKREAEYVTGASMAIRRKFLRKIGVRIEARAHIMDKISQVMERYRLSAGKGGLPLSYAELGRRIGVSRTQAENFCKGRSIPSDEAVLRISQEIGYDDMRLMVLQHHDRAPGRVKQAWKQIMGIPDSIFETKSKKD